MLVNKIKFSDPQLAEFMSKGGTDEHRRVLIMAVDAEALDRIKQTIDSWTVPSDIVVLNLSCCIVLDVTPEQLWRLNDLRDVIRITLTIHSFK